MSKRRSRLSMAVCAVISMVMLIVNSIGLIPAMKSSALATQRKYYDKSYTLTGNGATDMVAVAKKQVGKTESDLHYDGRAWCAYFISDVAILAGQSAAIPENGSCSKMRDAITKAGGTTVKKSEVKPGDLFFYDWGHVGVVISNSNGKLTVVSGNSTRSDGGSGVTQHALLESHVLCYMRPKYTNTNVPVIPYVTIPEGDYYIKNSSTGTYINSNDASNGGTVSLAAKKETNAFKMYVNGEYLKGRYIIPRISKDYALNPYTSNTPADGTKITLWKKNTDGHQNWKFEQSGDGYIIHCCANENVVLTASGSGIVLKNRTGSKDQVWMLEEVSPVTLSSISAKALRAEYPVNAVINGGSVSVTAKYSDGSTKDVSDEASFSCDTSMMGTETVSVSFEGKTASVDINVVPMLYGSGVEDDPFLIDSKEHLEIMRDLVNDTAVGGYYRYAYYTQMSDIDLENEKWFPIGVGHDGDDGNGAYNWRNRMFYGHYDGNHHYIRGLNVEGSLYSGLFGTVRGGGSVKDLVVVGKVNGGSDASGNESGGITAALHYDATISGCAFIGDVTSPVGSAGGIVGNIWCMGTIENCYHIGSVNGVYAGGIAARVGISKDAATNSSLIKNCYHVGKIKGTTAAGGTAASSYSSDGTAYTLDITNCYVDKNTSLSTVVCSTATSDDTAALSDTVLKKIASELGDMYKDDTVNNVNSGYPIFVWQGDNRGDVNGDGKVSTADLVMLEKWLTGASSDIADMDNADLVKDGRLDSFDLVMLRKTVIAAKEDGAK